MSDLIVIASVLSVLFAVVTYLRAFRIHEQVEEIHPGFNERMRKTCPTLRKWGLKR